MIRKAPFLLGAFLVVGLSSNAQRIVPDATTPPAITTQPANVTVKVGTTATFKVIASGTATLKYQWYNASMYPASPISGATLTSYTTPATTDADNGRGFYVTVTNAAGSVTSNTASLTVVDPPVIYQQPQSLVVTAPAVATFTVYAQGTWPMTFQWYKNGIAISGATEYTYTSSETTTADNGAKFTVVVGNAAGKVTSAPAILTVNPFNKTGTLPIVGEWSGTATINSPDGTKLVSQVVAGFWQTSYSLNATIVYVDENGIPQMGAGMASLNNLNVFTVTDAGGFGGGTAIIGAAFSTNQLTLNGSGGVSGDLGDDAGNEPWQGAGTLTLSSDHNTLTGTSTLSDGTAMSWKLTRTK